MTRPFLHIISHPTNFLQFLCDLADREGRAREGTLVRAQVLKPFRDEHSSDFNQCHGCASPACLVKSRCLFRSQPLSSSPEEAPKAGEGCNGPA